MVGLYFIAGWMAVAIVIGLIGSVRLHRDPHWMSGHPRDDMDVWFPVVGQGEWNDWPGTGNFIWWTALAWPAFVGVMGAVWFLSWFGKIVCWPFFAVGRIMIPKPKAQKWLKHR